MDSDPDGGDRPTARTVPLDSIPVPVFGYDVRDGEPVVVATNDPLASAFGPVSTGTALGRWLREEVGADDAQVEDVCSALADGQETDVDIEAGPTGVGRTDGYRLRTLEGPGPGDVEGYVLLTELDPDRGDGTEIDRIASVISHDLRNPLDVANAHLQAARETGEAEHFDQVRQSHDRMAQIIQDVLTLARGRNALSITAGVDVGAVATDAWATVDTRGASLAVADDLPRVEADPDRLQRLFENLFRNSVEHAHPPANGGEEAPDHRLQVRVGATGRGFFVADNGTGIAEEDRGRVFDPGYSSETGGGTGLGLTIVEEIAEAHGWAISVTDGAGGGARFEFQPRSRGDR